MKMNKDSKIYVAGHNGMVGSAIVRILQAKKYKNLILKSRDQLDLRNQTAVLNFINNEKPEYIFLCAAKVGGILSNLKNPAIYISDNLKIQSNVIESAHSCKVKKLIFLGSSCIYPKEIQNNIKEDDLLSGRLEESNLPYAVAKIAGKVLCDAYRSQYGFNAITVMPSNIYGVNDNFHPNNSHLVAGIMNRIHDGKIKNKKNVHIWGTGEPLRELLYVDDLASACILLMEKDIKNNVVNIGSEDEISVRHLAEKISEIIGYNGKLEYDRTKPDGVMRKKLNTSIINNLGWKQSIQLESGLEKMYRWYLKNNIYEKNINNNYKF
jgi:GDP-L-fucose synthase